MVGDQHIPMTREQLVKFNDWANEEIMKETKSSITPLEHGNIRLMCILACRPGTTFEKEQTEDND